MSFRLRTIVGIALIQAFLMVTIILSAQFLMLRSHENELHQRALTTAKLFATTTKDAVLSMDLASLKSFVEEVLSNPDVTYARVMNADNQTLAAAGPQELLSRSFKADTHISRIDDGVFDTFAEIEEAGLSYGRVEIGISTQSITAAITDARFKITGLAIAEIVLSLLLSMLLGAFLVRRLSHLKEASERISAGEIGYQITVKGNDEISLTARTFNQMSRHLERLLGQINAKNVSLESEIKRRIAAEAKLQKAHEQLEKRVAARTKALASTNKKLKNEIQERQSAESKKQELEARLQRIEKMEALGTLAGGVAHDLNNVLSGIASYPDLLLLQLDATDPMRKSLEIIRNSGQKAAAIVQDLMTLARRGVSATEVLNLNDIVENYLKSPEFEMLASTYPQTHLTTALQKDLLNIEGSPVHLFKSIMNLVTNAAEAMPTGGAITVQTENRYVDKPIKGYDAIVEGDYVVLRVMDQGIGISSKDRERIFEPFYTKKKMGRSGTGLGMAVVWGTVKDHRGYIDIQSRKDAGSTFILYFPCTRKPLTTASTQIPVDRYRGNGETILVIDDVAEQRQIAHALLTELGYTVETSSSGEAAITFLSKKTVDLIILDMIMEPGMDGLDTYKAIVDMHPGQKAIIASGFSETERVRETQRLGAGEYIKKPYTIENIGLAIRNLLDMN